MEEKNSGKLRTPLIPSSKESEMMVLGSMLTSSSALGIGADGLDVGDFYYSEHQIIFKALKQAFTSDKPADIHLISEELKRIEKLDAVGGIAYLTTVAQYAGTSVYIEEYVDIVRKKSILRQMIDASKVIERKAMEEPEDVYSALDEAQSYFFKISQAANQTVGIHIREILSGLRTESHLPYLKELQERQEKFHNRDPNEVVVSGLPSGFKDLDRLIGGFNTSNLTILAARPSMGKTAFAINIAEHIAFELGLPVAVFSLEMTAEELVHRIICSRAEVESDKIRTGSLDGLEYQRVVASVNDMGKYTFIVDDQPGMKITDLRARARRLKEVYNIQFMVVDYLQLLSGSRGYYNVENRQNEISEISRMLKNLARELNIPILCLSQLSRKVEERAGHRPMLSDLRESGCLTGDALIQDANTGHFHTIKELAERSAQTPISVYALGPDLKMGKHLMTKAFYSGKKQVYELTTRSGQKIKASSNHPFRKREGWVALEHLHIGDALALPLKGDIFWDEIASIESLGVEDVYDATVPGVHNFVANGIIVHNSIEQDADIVMFIFRREYYNAKDKPGVAEVIVAKNRHGGVGDVELAFRKKFARFNNYLAGNTEEPEEVSNAFSEFSPN